MKTSKDYTIGTEIIGKPHQLAEARVFAFSGGPFNAPGWPAANIHTNLKFAQSVQLPTRAVSATQYQSHVVDMLINLFGEVWFKTGKIDSKFIAIVDVSDTITPHLKIVSREAEEKGVRVNLEGWSENQHGNKVLIGTASCLLDK
jgi:acyl dehydratase